MSLPDTLAAAIGQQLGAVPQSVRVLSGGATGGMARCFLGGQPSLIKWSGDAPPPGWPDRCAAEAHGLRLLADTGALRVPRVLGVGDRSPLAWLAIEWIDGASVDREQAGGRLGHGLALLHRGRAAAYGLDRHNYCGASPQRNDPGDSWIAFYGQQRLGVQIALAGAQGRMPAPRRRRLERLIERLDRWIDERSCQPSLIHGDLWGGNWLIDGAGDPVLIDPAAYHGDREAELAMCHLFGGFPRSFFAAYDEAWPPAPGRDDRLPLYQLYHVLNHLTIFGEGYGEQVDRIARRYVG